MGLGADPIYQILEQYWGYSRFRKGQEEIVRASLENRDILALLPTGGGKSLCYQLPAVLSEGITLVISPLIALMRDQVRALREKGIRANAVYAGMDFRTIDRILDNCVYGEVKLLYMSPERLQTDLARARISKMQLNRVAVDEAHCISQWGYDFRPAYLNIASIREWHPGVPITALTATATPRVREDILEKLDLKEPLISAQSFVRHNLALEVRRTADKLHVLKQAVATSTASGIVYVRNRKKTVSLAMALQQAGIRAEAYHAGLDSRVRTEIQQRWLEDKTRVIVCTNAFGMGIDKGDVDFVGHYDIPPSLEEYFQEAGRAGRDGDEARCLLVYDNADRDQLAKNFALAYPSMDLLRNVYKALHNYYQIVPGQGMHGHFAFDLQDFCRHFQLKTLETYHCLRILEQEGWIHLSDAVWLPSRAKVIVGKEEVYRYQVEKEGPGDLLTAMLRTYEGLFLETVRIHEDRLARVLEVDKAQVINHLRTLHRDGMIQYLEATDSPHITFLRDRSEARNFSIDLALQKWRKARDGERLQAMLDYLVVPGCRMQFILHYFGETGAGPCGKCDRCTMGSEKRPGRFSKALIGKIPPEGMSVKALLTEFSGRDESGLLRSLAYLEQEAVIRVHNDMVYLNHEMKGEGNDRG